MDIGSEGVSVYAEAKGEQTRQLCQFLVHSLQKYFLELLEESKQKEPEARRVLLMFQGLLKDIPDWNMEKVQRETTKIANDSGCDYLEELLAAVFIAHTKVLSAIRITNKQKKLNITIPKIDHFIHRTMIECARLLWTNAYLFSSAGSSIERQKNLRQVESLISEGVLQAIRGMLPVKSILREYIREDEEETDAEESAPASKKKAVEEEEEEPPKEEVKEEPPKEEVKEEPPKEEVKEEPKEGPKEESKEEPPKEEVKEEPKEEVKEEPKEEGPPTIVVDEQQPSVGFTQMDEVFDHENPEQTILRMQSDFDEDESGEIQILDEAPIPIQDFEEIVV